MATGNDGHAGTDVSVSDVALRENEPEYGVAITASGRRSVAKMYQPAAPNGPFRSSFVVRHNRSWMLHFCACRDTTCGDIKAQYGANASTAVVRRAGEI